MHARGLRDFPDGTRRISERIADGLATKPYFPEHWIRTLLCLMPSLGSLEWDCHGETRDLWRFILQFRTAGLRARDHFACTAVVAMAIRQIPVRSPEQRSLTRVQGSRFQGSPYGHPLPRPGALAFRARRNPVHFDVARTVFEGLLDSHYGFYGQSLEECTS